MGQSRKMSRMSAMSRKNCSPGYGEGVGKPSLSCGCHRESASWPGQGTSRHPFILRNKKGLPQTGQSLPLHEGDGPPVRSAHQKQQTNRTMKNRHGIARLEPKPRTGCPLCPASRPSHTRGGENTLPRKREKHSRRSAIDGKAQRFRLIPPPLIPSSGQQPLSGATPQRNVIF